MKSNLLFTVASLTFSDMALSALASDESSAPEQFMPELTAEELFYGLEETQNDSPVVRAFRKNIYTEQYFTDSVYYVYLAAFWTGYNMQSYLHALDCLDDFSLFMNFFHEWYLMTIYYREGTELWDLFFLTAGTSANDAWYQCALFQLDFTETYKTKYATFGGDFGNLYLSAIFNLLSNSLNIRSQTETMIEAYDEHDTETFAQALGNIMRSCLDFNSYTSVQAASKTPSVDEFLGQTQAPISEKPYWQREQEMNARLEAAQKKYAETIESGVNNLKVSELE